MNDNVVRQSRIISDDGKFVFTLKEEKDGIVRARSVGYQDEAASMKLVKLLEATHQRMGSRIKLVLDITELDGIDPLGRKIITDMAIGTDSIIQRLAVFGGSFFLRHLIKLYCRVFNVPLGMFQTEAEALEWLSGENG